MVSNNTFGVDCISNLNDRSPDSDSERDSGSMIVQGLTLAMCPLARVHFLGCRASSGHNNSFSAGPRGQ